MPFSIHPKAVTYATIYGRLRDQVGAIKATRWMFSACEALKGKSPIEAMKAGREEEVEYAAAAFVAGVK